MRKQITTLLRAGYNIQEIATTLNLKSSHEVMTVLDRCSVDIVEDGDTLTVFSDNPHIEIDSSDNHLEYKIKEFKRCQNLTST